VSRVVQIELAVVVPAEPGLAALEADELAPAVVVVLNQIETDRTLTGAP